MEAAAVAFGYCSAAVAAAAVAFVQSSTIQQIKPKSHRH